MSYTNFAKIYDELMKDVPYEKWVRFFEEKKDKYQFPVQNILDIGCGTGELAILLSKKGYLVTGVDLSEEMLSIAFEKVKNAGVSVQLFEQDMRELEGLGTFDCVQIVCDSLNYLQDLDEVKTTFERVSDHLTENGMFIFDVHSIWKMQNQFNDQTYAENGEDVSFIWHALEGEESNSVVHDLTFFILNEKTEQYERFDEIHEQRTFSVEEYSMVLESSGFELLDVVGDFGESEIDTAERILFVARKK
ncbi:MAG: class SAM-dependent methyltransferase [Bacillales bacterium]|jgi:ubiquinone/menaquinone biosynthesis C-methylase UbiE|nr:class SAM-dependent methyltransferase [Bacillales bacterium]